MTRDEIRKKIDIEVALYNTKGMWEVDLPESVEERLIDYILFVANGLDEEGDVLLFISRCVNEMRAIQKMCEQYDIENTKNDEVGAITFLVGYLTQLNYEQV